MGLAYQEISQAWPCHLGDCLKRNADSIARKTVVWTKDHHSKVAIETMGNIGLRVRDLVILRPFFIPANPG